MKFLVTRTSNRFKRKPCKEATLCVTFLDSEDLRWFMQYWTIEFSSLSELQAFCDKHGEVVVSFDSWFIEDLPDTVIGEIEIYDTYRE